MRTRWRDEDAAAVRFAQEVEQAEADAIRAEAIALRKGSKPPASDVDAKRSELEDRRRGVAVLDAAVSDSYAALVAVVDEHRTEWVGTLDAEARGRREELVASVDRLAAADADLRVALQAVAWVARFPSIHTPKPARVGEAGLKKPSGEAYPGPVLVDALRVYAAGGAKSAAIA